MDIYRVSEKEEGLSEKEIGELLAESLNGRKLGRVLIVPPDFTRFPSRAGEITRWYYHALTAMNVTVDILPALGTHEPVSDAQRKKMFGDIPAESFHVHDWRNDVVPVGTVPSEVIREISDGLWDQEVTLEVNRMLTDPKYDLILSVGQVVPHEVIGMSNHAKNLFVGVGGSQIINQSHIIGAVCGMEQAMGKDHTPVRRLFDYGMEHFLKDLPIVFVLTVCTAPHGDSVMHGLFIGDGRKCLERAVALSQQKNIDFVDRGFRKCVVYLDPEEFHTTWLGNKAVYRTRTAMADGGELIVLAPGIVKFGEDATNDVLIRKYGYCGREKVLELIRRPECGDLRENYGAAAHLIHGSSDGRFTVTYAVQPEMKKEIEQVGYQYADVAEMMRRYDPAKLAYGWNEVDGEEIFFIPNPALGLWIDSQRFGQN